MFRGKLFTWWDLPTYFSNFDDAFLISLELLKNFMVQSNCRVFQHDQNMLIYWALKCMFICSFLKMQDIFNFSAIFKYCLSLTNHLRLYGRNQKQSPEVGFSKKGVLKNFAKFTGDLCQSLLFNQVAGFSKVFKRTFFTAHLQVTASVFLWNFDLKI